MLSASEQKSLREFASSRISSGSVVVREGNSGRFVVTDIAQQRTVGRKRSDG
jgi:hypothetical protein